MVSLSDRQKRSIGQHFVFGFHGTQVSDDVRVLIQQYYIGNIILMKRNIHSFEQTRNLVSALQKLAQEVGHPRPLLIGIDQENGLVSAFSKPDAGIQFPGAMAQAAASAYATDTEQPLEDTLAYRVARATAVELRAAGITWAYAPVADVNSEPENPVIGVRSFGDDPHQVARLVTASAKGLHDGGVAPCAKHYPGHGDTKTDSHLALPSIRKTLKELQECELIPFHALFKYNVASIMTGHIALPGCPFSSANAEAREDPGTATSLSRALHTYLRTPPSSSPAPPFSGVVVTDCLEMSAVSSPPGPGTPVAAARALAAGADITMVCHTFDWQKGAVEATWALVESGEWDEAAQAASAKRIADFKGVFAETWEDALRDYVALDDAPSKLKEHAALSAAVYAASIAFLPPSTASNFVPFTPGTPVILFTPKMESLNKAVDDAEGILRTADGRQRNTAGPSYLKLAEHVAARSPCRHVVYGRADPIDAALVQSQNTRQILFVTRNTNTGAWQLEQLQSLAKALASNLEPSSPLRIHLLASCLPYDYPSLDKMPTAGTVRLDTRLACFEFTPPAFEAAVAVLFGENPASGRVPVSLA